MRDLIAQSVKHTLHAQARRNELLIAFTRVVLSIAALALNGAFVALGASSGVSMPAIIHLPIATYAAVSVAFAVAMHRGWYRLGAARVFQVVDGVAFVTVTYTVVRSVGVDTANAWGMMPESAAICALLAASTGLRLDAIGTIIGSVTALGAFVACAVLLGFGAWETSYVASVVLACGFLGLWMTRIVERAARVEVEKVIMRRFLPQHLEVGSESLESLVAQPKRLDATVLVSDLRDFTLMAESLTPPAVLRLLNTFQGALAAVVRTHGGTVDKFLGDGMLAVFTSAATDESHAERALAAADAMTGAVERINDRRTRDGEAPLRVGIALHAGDVVIGCLGSAGRLELTIIGDTVNTAARLQQLTKKLGTVLCTADVVERLASTSGMAARLRSIGPVSVPGRSESVVVLALEPEQPRSTAPLRKRSKSYELS
jgi:class 3 adenylate cyclase